MSVSGTPVKLVALLASVWLLSAAHAGAASDMESRIHSSSFTTTDGVQLHVLEACPPGADPRQSTQPVVAFVPGWSMPAEVWRDQLETLGTWRCVAALDPRGQGKSAVPESGYTIERRAADVHEFISRYPRVVLVGWSLGALEALECIARHGHATVDGLVLVDSSVGEEPAPVPGPGPSFRERLQQDRRTVVADFVQGIFGKTRDAADIAAWTAGALRMTLEESLSLFPSAVPRTHWRDIAYAYPKPLFYMVSPQFAAQSESLLYNRPGTQVAVFEDAGHALFVDDPERFTALLEGFVAAEVEAARLRAR